MSPPLPPAVGTSPSSGAAPARGGFFRARRLGHVNLWVEDLARSQRFYHERCGLALEFWEPSLIATFLGTGNTPHDIGMIETTQGEPRLGRDGMVQIPAGVGTQVGLNHIAWEVDNERDLVEAYRRVTAAGIVIDRVLDHQIAHSIYLRDPDGNAVEFYCDMVADWRRVVQGEMDLLTGRWTPGETEPSAEPRYDLHPAIRFVEAAPVHPRRISHVVLTTRDLLRLVDFYAAVGGMEVVHRAPRGGVAFLRGEHRDYRYHLAICEDRADTGYHHAAFELAGTAAVDAAERALERQGMTPERRIDNASKRSFFLVDPDGFRAEYFAWRADGFPDPGTDAAERAYLI